MEWSKLQVGKYRGKTLPQVMFKDPDWFFWAYENNVFTGDMHLQAEEIYRRARSVKLSQENMCICYIIHKERFGIGKFGTMHLIQNRPGIENLYVSTLIDFRKPREYAAYDKTGYKNFIAAFKGIMFGNASRRMSKKACEAFFGNDSNFCLN